MSRNPLARRRLLGIVLSMIFLLAIVMGAGPGIYLVNPDPADPDASLTFVGMPVVYAWVIFWFLVEAGVVLVAYFTVWNGHRWDASRQTPDQDQAAAKGLGR